MHYGILKKEIRNSKYGSNYYKFLMSGTITKTFQTKNRISNEF